MVPLSTVLALSSLVYIALATPVDNALRPGASLQSSWLHSAHNRDRLQKMSELREHLMQLLNTYFENKGIEIDENNLREGIDAFMTKPTLAKRFDQEDFGLRFGKRNVHNINDKIDVALRWGR